MIELPSDDDYEDIIDDRKLQFTERFRPKCLNDVISSKQTISEFKKFVKSKQMPHLILYGPPGTGKTSTILACAEEMYGENINYMTLIINASEDRGIQTMRDTVLDFCKTKGMFITKNIPVFKLIILDEADLMTLIAQGVLRSMIENNTSNVRFILICNYISKINNAIRSRCISFRYSSLTKDTIKKKIMEINKELELKIKDDGLNALCRISDGDMRKVLNLLQASSIVYNVINEKNICSFFNYPLSKDIEEIFNIITTKNLIYSYDYIKKLTDEKGYNVSNILKEIYHLLKEKYIKKQTKSDEFSKIIVDLGIIEVNIALGCNNELLLQMLVGTFAVNKI